MSNEAPQTLRDVARAALDANPGVSGRQLERLAKKRGLTISYTTINHLAAGTYKSRPSRKTLEALADLAGLDVEQVYRAAGEPMPRLPLRDDLPPDADLLTGPQRRVVVEIVRTFAQQNRELETYRAREREDVMGNAEHPAPTSLTLPATPATRREERDRILHGPTPTGLDPLYVIALVRQVEEDERLEALSAESGRTPLAIAAHEEEVPIAGETGHDEHP